MSVFTYGLETPWFEEVSREWIYRYFKNSQYIQFDTETTGFSPHSDELMCVQLGNSEDQFVISPAKIKEFKKLLEEKILIAHNCKFDAKFMYKKDIWPNQVYDTMLAEQVIHCGNPTVRHNLAAVAKRRINVDLDKSVRDNIWKEGLTQRVIQYAADDVKHLESIKDAQAGDLESLDLFKCLDLENNFTLVLAYIEFCGFKLDKDKWQKKMDNDLLNLLSAEEGLNQFLIDNKLNDFISMQLDMFSTDIKTTINWSSSKQVIKLFKQIGISVEITEKGEKKESVEAANISKYAKEYPIITQYLDYKEKEKLVGTYGQSFLNQINPVTGRIHTNFKQILDTGRISSGGKNKATKEQYVNLQNIPSDKDTRACFVAEEGNTLVICDYSGQEQIVLANYSMDENILEFYDKGLGDMHAFVASKMYPELDGLDLEEIKTVHKDKRQEAKIAGFAINYGGVGKTIADQLNKTLVDGERVYEAYFNAFPGLKSYFDQVKKRGLNSGYILIDNVVKRKSFIYGYDQYQRLRKEMGERFWHNWKLLKANKKSAEENNTEVPSSEKHLYYTYREKIKKFFQIKGEIERKSLNFPIQGSSANISKYSAVLYFTWLKDAKLVNIVKMVNQIHDENVIECPLEIAKKAGEALTECMNRAAAIYCKRVPLTTIPDYCTHWRK